MNHKPWLWRKRSMEKTIFAADKVVSPSRPIEEEDGLERSSKSLNEKLATVLLDSHSGDDPLAKHVQKPQQEIRGKDKTQHQVESVEDLGEKASAETVSSADTTLQEPLQPPSCDQEEQKQKLCSAIPKISKEHEKIQKELEEKLRETSKRIDDLTAENTHLSNALLTKEKSIGDLVKCKQETDAEFSTLMARLDNTEKENSFLRYEFHVLEKEIEIRKEEMDYSRQYADASHKQYLECSQKASKLEAECQKLRLLLQKRSPGSAGLVNMKNEVGVMRRRKPNPTRELIYKKNDIGNSPYVSEKSFGLMIKRLQDMDEENKALKRILNNKNSELESSRLMYAETASRLSQAEILLRKISENQKSMELARCYPTSNELSLMSNFEIYSDDEAISSGSWANALISELEHLRTSEAKIHKSSNEVPYMSCMDDFVEMEKRAIVSIDTPKRGCFSDISGRELVPVQQDHLGFSERKQEIQFKNVTEKSFDWLQIVLNAILEEKFISKRSLYELLDDIKIALDCINHPTACKSETTKKSRHPGESDSFSFNDFAEAESNRHINSNLRKSLQRIINLIEGIAPKSFICNNCPGCLEENKHSDTSQSPTSKDYFVHVFQWKVSDLNPLLHQLVHTCKDLLTGKADFEIFIEELAFALDWSINNCATSTNAAIARDKIKKHFSTHFSQNENKIDVEDKQSSRSPSFAYPDDQCELFNAKNNQNDLLEEIRKLKDDLRSTKTAKKDLEEKLVSVTDESQNLTKQCQEAQNNIRGLESEIESLKEAKETIEDQIEKQKIISEDLDTQLTIAQAKLNDIFQKFSSLEVELEDKKNSCEELEATCLELQLQLESIAKKESPTYGRYEVEKIYQTGWEITTASSKLAECQETILNLGKQLKALASSNEVAHFDKVVSTTSTMANPTQKKNLIKRSSLRNHMQAEDEAKGGKHKSVQTEETKSDKDVQRPPVLHSENEKVMQSPSNAPETCLTSEQNDRSKVTGSMAIVPSKRQVGFGFLRKLLSRRHKGRGKGAKLLAKA
ncbi:filament-like plant protein 7 isoform X2 [Cajanus cajan]|nr:filament-like plant protein 7 isoform X2 [Cajanus cajan]XP_020236619.1 filament-like plant protein 7 isoform X2 [Cajanus cajan]XP_020236620.1 filament-like plant protein 7 isoform X2 [Cajanus cajan]XP_020236621.1 filament-like plant protein 7 isoform X2 [Cajanus cajan]XP_029130764.1 filament-like plant protein 7 isoform X2 [Cajanus cajan]